jgi:hypothetical protein
MASSLDYPTLAIAPAQVMRGVGILKACGDAIDRFGSRPLIVGGDRSLAVAEPFLPLLKNAARATYGEDCSEVGLAGLRRSGLIGRI